MKKKLAIIGFSYMGPMHYRIVTEKVPGLEVKGIWDIRASCRAKAREMGLYAYNSLEELLADPSIDLVTIATPNDSHRDLAVACLEAGKHVICEKPVCMNTSELDDIVAAAQRTGGLFSVHHNRRWDPDYCAVRQVLQEGTIGRPIFIESRINVPSRALYNWRGYALNGGGALLDWGIHLLDQLLDLLQVPVTAVSAHILSLNTPDADDMARVFLHFAGGCSALCELAWSSFIKAPRWRINAEHGSLQIFDPVDRSSWQLVQADFSGEKTAREDLVYTKAGPETRLGFYPSDQTRTLPLPDPLVDWSDYYKNVLAALAGQADLRVTAGQARRVLQVVEAAHISSADGGAAKKCLI